MIPSSLWDGYMQANSADEAEALAARLVAQGRIVARRHDYGREPYRVHIALVAHPALPSGEVYALFWMGLGCPKTYRTTEADAAVALADPGCFNLA